MLRRGLRPVNARPPFDDIEINLDHAAFAERQIHEGGERNFEWLAQDGGAVPEKKVFRRLHGDGAAAAFRLSVHHRVGGLVERRPIDAVMGAEAAILGGDDLRAMRFGEI